MKWYCFEIGLFWIFGSLGLWIPGSLLVILIYVIFRRFAALGGISLLLFLQLSAWSLPVAAADDPNTATFTISPALIDKKVNPGDSFETTITIINRTDTPQPMRVYTKNFAAQNLEGEITFGDEDITSYAAASWITLDQPSILLEPKGSVDVKAMVSVPKNAEPGGHYASVLFEQMIQDAPSQTSHVAIAARLAALMFITVSGDVREAGQVLGARPGSKCSAIVCGFTAPKFLDKGPVPFSFIFDNTGNVHVRPKGQITIWQGKTKVATLPIEDRAVLPDSQRLFETKWDRIVLSGHYTAKLHLVYGTNNYTIDEQTDFWAFPWQVVLAIVIIITIALAIFLSRKYFHVQRLHIRAKNKK